MRPSVTEVALNRQYSFQYENCVLATQSEVFLLLEKAGEKIRALRFPFRYLKYGGPNDEARGGHPMSKFGLGFYGLYRVANSPWLQEVVAANRVHPRHSISLFQGLQHFIACFKDVTLEVISSEYEEVELTESKLLEVFRQQLGYLECDD